MASATPGPSGTTAVLVRVLTRVRQAAPDGGSRERSDLEAAAVLLYWLAERANEPLTQRALVEVAFHVHHRAWPSIPSETLNELRSVTKPLAASHPYALTFSSLKRFGHEPPMLTGAIDLDLAVVASLEAALARDAAMREQILAERKTHLETIDELTASIAAMDLRAAAWSQAVTILGPLLEASDSESRTRSLHEIAHARESWRRILALCPDTADPVGTVQQWKNRARVGRLATGVILGGGLSIAALAAVIVAGMLLLTMADCSHH